MSVSNSAKPFVVGIIILLAVIGICSLAYMMYPSVQVPVYQTGTTLNTSSYVYPVTVFTAVQVPYSTAMVTLISYYYQPGNFPGCDPASSACMYGIPNAYVTYSTTTYSQLSTSYFQVSSTVSSTFTNRVVNTNFQNIPMYSALGMNTSQFIFLTALVVICIAAAVCWFRNSTRQ